MFSFFSHILISETLGRQKRERRISCFGWLSLVAFSWVVLTDMLQNSEGFRCFRGAALGVWGVFSASFSGPRSPRQPATWQDSTLFSLPGNPAILSTFWADFLLTTQKTWRNAKKSLEREYFSNSVETAPRNGRYLSLVVVECVLAFFNVLWYVLFWGNVVHEPSRMLGPRMLLLLGLGS